MKKSEAITKYRYRLEDVWMALISIYNAHSKEWSRDERKKANSAMKAAQKAREQAYEADED